MDTSTTAAAAGHLGFPLETVILFIGIVAFSLYMDLWAHRKAEHITMRDAVGWSIFWVALSLGFYGYLYYHHGAEPADLFLSGYALEKSLSVDNLMVFIAVFSYFGIEDNLQHRILYYGILGAIAFRLIFVALGSGLLLTMGGWADFIFAGLIGYSAIMMFKGLLKDDEEEEVDYANHKVVKFAERMFKVFPRLDGTHFFVSGERARELAAQDPSIKLKDGGKAARYITPALVCLMVIEASDIMFAFDSVPAVIAVTQEPLLVYAAMLFAILGLRSLYFVLAAMAKYLVYLEHAVVLLLGFIAVKLALHGINSIWGTHLIEIDHKLSLYIILGVLALGIVASLIKGPKDEDSQDASGGAA